jgi:uncharacterized RDD family membrane protein YckC
MSLSTTFERILAALLDAVILVPISEIILRFIPAKSGQIFVLGILIYSILYVGYAIILNWKFGGTVGKLLAGLRVKSIDGTPITLNQAFRRSSVDLMFQFMQIAEFYILIKRGQIEDLPAVSISAMRASMYEQKYIFSDVMFYIEMGWLLSEFITMQFNAKKRALHDFIAGTIVLTDFRRKKTIKSLLWVSSIIFFLAFIVFSMSTSDDTTGRIQTQNALWSAKSTEEIRSILKENNVYPNRVNSFEQNVIHIAVKNADIRTFALFLQAYPELVNSSDFFGDTPSHLALRLNPEKYAILKSAGPIERKFNRFGQTNMP